MRLMRLGQTPEVVLPADQPDIRGWAVYDGAGARVGVVTDLLLGVPENLVLFAVADLGDRRVQLPAGRYDLDAERLLLISKAYNRSELLDYPAFDESLLVQTFGLTQGTMPNTRAEEIFLASEPSDVERELPYQPRNSL